MTITLAEFAIGFAYGALLEGFWNGQTIGKRLFHLRVIDQSGLPATDRTGVDTQSDAHG